MSRHILYLNVHAVTRHYGGPEESGWYYNVGTPLASVPFFGTVVEREAGETPTWTSSTYAIERDCADDCEAPCEYHQTIFVRYDAEHVDAERVRLHAMFADVKHGSIYSVLGGTAIEVRIGHGFAETWPEETPRYE